MPITQEEDAGGLVPNSPAVPDRPAIHLLDREMLRIAGLFSVDCPGRLSGYGMRAACNSTIADCAHVVDSSDAVTLEVLGDGVRVLRVFGAELARTELVRGLDYRSYFRVRVRSGDITARGDRPVGTAGLALRFLEDRILRCRQDGRTIDIERGEGARTDSWFPRAWGSWMTHLTGFQPPIIRGGWASDQPIQLEASLQYNDGIS